MKTVHECLQIARELNLHYNDFERISDELLMLEFHPTLLNCGIIETITNRFGDSFWNYTIRPYLLDSVKLHIIVKPSDYVQS